MGGCAEGLFRIELVVTVVMPLLERKSKTLVVEKFRVELVFTLGGDKDDLKEMCSFAIARPGDTFSFTVRHGRDLEKE